MAKARFYLVEHFKGDSFDGAENAEDDPRTFQEWLQDREEDRIVDIQYQVDGGTHHIMVVYTEG